MGERPGQFGGIPNINNEYPSITANSLNFSQPSELQLSNEGNYFGTGMEPNFIGTPPTFGQLGTTMPEGGLSVPGNPESEGFGLWDRMRDGDFGSLQGWGQMLGGIGDIGSAYMSYKNYGLAKDQFAFNKNLTNRNLSNQAAVTNAKLGTWAQARGVAAPKVDGTAIG